MAEQDIGLSRELIALRVARELREGMTVNLGIGLPTLVANFVPAELEIFFQAENGILGYGGISESDFDSDLINAGGQPVTIRPGASFFDSAASFAMIRGGHIDVAVLGGLEVSERGDLANWYIPERGGGSIGGAMDLAVIEVRPDGLLLTEVAPGVTPEDVQARTEPELHRSPQLREMTL